MGTHTGAAVDGRRETMVIHFRVLGTFLRMLTLKGLDAHRMREFKGNLWLQ
jgi:hypothetical protein